MKVASFDCGSQVVERGVAAGRIISPGALVATGDGEEANAAFVRGGENCRFIIAGLLGKSLTGGPFQSPTASDEGGRRHPVSGFSAACHLCLFSGYLVLCMLSISSL